MPPHTRFRLATIVGARPQFIKASAFSRVWRKSDLEVLIHTGQHYDWRMSDIFFRELSLPKPDFHLGIQSTSRDTRIHRMIEGLTRLLRRVNPHGVLIYGDTDSTLAGALAAVRAYLPVFHVEAGLRSFNRRMPEENNRLIADHCSQLLFAPTPAAADHLKREGITEGVHVVGDIMIDTLRRLTRKPRRRTIRVPKHAYALATVHRAAATDDPRTLRRLCKALGAFPLEIVWPVHPRTQQAIKRNGIVLHKRIHVIPPVGYADSIALQEAAEVVLTDSGGIQKESYFLKTPCITLRNETEWTETLQTGHNALGGTSLPSILRAFKRVNARKRSPWPALYGRGDASEKIAKIIRAFLQNS